MQQGYVQLYTGNGKGKTTAMLGLTLRAVGAGLKVYLGQFIKDMQYSEIKAVRDRLPEVCLEQYGTGEGIFIGRSPKEADRAAALAGLEKAKQAMCSGNYDLVILDEVNIAVHYKLILAEELLAFLGARPSCVEVVLTGRYAHPDIIAAADLVSEITPVKHYYADQGVTARTGIER